MSYDKNGNLSGWLAGVLAMIPIAIFIYMMMNPL